MPRAFVRMPSPQEARTFVSTAVLGDRLGTVPYQSRRLDSVLTVNLEQEEIDALARSGAKVYADFEFESTGPVRRDAPGTATAPLVPEGLDEVLDQIRAPIAWSTSRGSGVTIAIVDTGVCGSLTEFPAAKRSPIDLPTAYAGHHWTDVKGHGSMCAAIAAATKSAGGKFNGVAPDATVLSARTTLMATDIFRIYDELLAAKTAGTISGPLVISNSYGLYTCAPPAGFPADHPYLEVVIAAVDSGIPVIFAAGNNHWDVLCNHPPANCSPNTIWAVNSHDKVLCVGTVNRAESNRDPATPHPNSSRGPGQWAVSTSKPDCVAPTYGQVVWGCGYTIMPWWGTSGACPQAAGLAALILGKNPSLSSTQVYDIIRNSCRSLSAPATCVGSGIIDCSAAVALA